MYIIPLVSKKKTSFLSTKLEYYFYFIVTFTILNYIISYQRSFIVIIVNIRHHRYCDNIIIKHTHTHTYKLIRWQLCSCLWLQYDIFGNISTVCIIIISSLSIIV